MASLEERVTKLEARVEQLAHDQQHGTDLAVTAAREALTAREAHQKNIELLNALRKTQSEHTQRLDSMDQRFDRIDDRLERIEGSLGVLTVGMHSIESLLARLAGGGDEAHHS